jgi:hypothetical protein
MSKARLVITAVIVEKRPVSEVASAYGVARSWIYTLLARAWLRIIWRCWQDGAAFDPALHRARQATATWHRALTCQVIMKFS